MEQQDAALLDVFRVVAAEAQRIVEDVRPEQWHDPTPCTGWDVQQLTAHVVTGLTRFAALANGEMEQLPPRPQAPAVDALGDDPAAAFRVGVQRLTEAFERPDFFAGTYQSPIGALPGAGLVQMRLTELTIHSWDLARATGNTVHLPDEIVEQVLRRMHGALDGRPRQPGPFGEPQPVADDAPAIDRLAAFLGRST